MKFDKVSTEHINLAIKDFKEKGFPEGFKQSAYFDIEIEGELYPPKPIMAYANYHATGEEPTNNFSGGVDTPCFKAFERLGISIIKKTKTMSSNEELYKLKVDFLKEWPIDRLKTMTIEEYTNLEKTSFCYSLESKTTAIGSIWGGSSYKFGIFKRRDTDSENHDGVKAMSDGIYGWYGKYGSTRDDAFNKVKETIIEIATLSQNNTLAPIEDIDFGFSTKWKVAFLYSDYNLTNIFNIKALKTCANYLGYEDEDNSYIALNKYVLSQKGDEDYYDFSIRIWAVFGNKNSNANAFEKWLKSKNKKNSGKVNSYMRALDLLTNHFKIDIYNENDIDVLEDLYSDLNTHQKEINGKYYFEKAKSYGTGGFYSAAVGSYIEFIKEQDIDFETPDDEEQLVNLLSEIGHKDAISFYNIMESILNELSISMGDNRVCYNLPKNKLLGLTIGQKYCVKIERKSRKNSFSYFDTLNNDKNWLKEAKNIEEIEFEFGTIVQSAKNELIKTDKTGHGEHSSISLEKSLFDITYKNNIFQKAFNTDSKLKAMKSDLNQIFFGPPGTGKTFHTINEAIKIADPEFYKIHKNDRDQLKARFKLLSLNKDNESVGQIGFTTFHQSFSYEDFIEGIKPNEPKDGDTFLKYEIQEGVFKKICRLADDSLNAVAVDTESLVSLSIEEYEKAHFYKMSLGNTLDESDNEIYEYCIENNCITIGFGNQLDFTEKDEKKLRTFGNDNNLGSFDIQAMNLFSNSLKIGNYVVISYGNKYVRAVGKVTGNYEYRDDSELPNNLHYKHFRSVEWIFTDEKISANEIYNKNLSMQTIYKLDKKYIKQEFFVNEKKIDTHKLPKNPKNFVLIVDEINRGNVSSVFGELITLIEKDKRAGADEELSVTLPYSKETFSVPQNVYIIGTMNTADRSIEALDTALRRRFSFREMPPKPELIKIVGSLKSTNGKLGDIDVVKILETINNRIEKLIDKDHKIGHSYFLNISSKQDLKDTFRDKVIPLLEEYFFGDFGKISLVLGSSFISKESTDGVKFATSNDYDSSIANDLIERSTYEITSENNWDFKAIYE
jgi:5-methylcytosine-specific restriction endonuclease McrBC GTP-binding regulatory subunit McrB